MSAMLRSLSGFLVADASGRVVGRVECALYGRDADVPDSLAVRGGLLRRRRLVPAEAVDVVDTRSGVVALNVNREALRPLF